MLRGVLRYFRCKPVEDAWDDGTNGDCGAHPPSVRSLLSDATDRSVPLFIGAPVLFFDHLHNGDNSRV